MKAYFGIYLIVLSLIFIPPFKTFANELPLHLQISAVPTLISTPSLPSIEVFGTPKPPSAFENTEANMPDIEFWQEKSLSWPVLGKISSGYGFRADGALERMHNGIDIPVPNGTPIQAAANGVVTEARTYTGYGYTVIIDHKNGTKTLYAHCSNLVAKQGEQVESGQVIAYAGSTGRATSPHVHFGVMVKGAFQDPVLYLKEKPQQFVKRPLNSDSF